MAASCFSTGVMTMGTLSICKWRENESDMCWDSDCSEKFVFNSDGPKENGFEFCPYCGRVIEQVYETKESDDDE